MTNWHIVATVFAVVCLQVSTSGQPTSNADIWRNIKSLDTNQGYSPARKLKLLQEWQKTADQLRLPRDSVYARLLHKIGVYAFYAEKKYNVALVATLQAVQINTSGKAGSSSSLAVTDLYNVAYFCSKLGLLKKALVYYDSAILFARRGPDVDNVIPDSWLDKANIYFRMGDFGKAVEESDRVRVSSLERKDSSRYLASLNQRSPANFAQGQYSAALRDARTAIDLGKALHQDFQLASAFKSQGFALSGLVDLPGAEASFAKGIAARIRSKQFGVVADDLNDLGSFYSDTPSTSNKAIACFLSAIRYAKAEGDSIGMARASLNLGNHFLFQGELEKAMSSYLQADGYLKIGKGDDLTLNPTAEELGSIGNKEMIQKLFNSKTEVLVALYRKTNDRKWLDAGLRTALLDDSLIRQMRHEQLGEPSKLYWRNETRRFFTSALEACYLAHAAGLAFFFMEESRSVLLQDRLNELGANAYLPLDETEKGERLRITVFELQQKLGGLSDTSRQGTAVLQELLVAKEAVERYIRSLEQRYPVYYQYKYADVMQPLFALQGLLKQTKQNFVEYFVEDTVCYALCVEPGRTNFLRMANSQPSLEDQLGRFVRFCSDENALNRDFAGFLGSANRLYNLLLKPFQLASGRVIICQDNGLVPFEALSRDAGKADFLIKDYSFSYVYSARYLLNQREQERGAGDFLGIAPVSFAAYRGMADLTLSEGALRRCAEPYHRTKLLLRGEASRQNFMRRGGDYSVTTILTHARADTSDEEPLLFLNDSVVRLSELQMLKNPAARLVVLSACQTNAGKNRNGEGVFSLARGFSAAGIPAVAATQWMADEAAIYSITQKLNEYLFAGMNKDEALRKAKLYYMYEDKKGSVLPCYWADMILIGNAEPVAFSRGVSLWWVAGALGFGLILCVVIARLSSGSYGFANLRRKGYPGRRR